MACPSASNGRGGAQRAEAEVEVKVDDSSRRVGQTANQKKNTGTSHPDSGAGRECGFSKVTPTLAHMYPIHVDKSFWQFVVDSIQELEAGT